MRPVGSAKGARRKDKEPIFITDGWSEHDPATASHDISNGDEVASYHDSHGEPVYSLVGYSEAVHRVSVSGDGQWLVMAGADRAARVWSIGILTNMELARQNKRNPGAIDAARASLQQSATGDEREWADAEGEVSIGGTTEAVSTAAMEGDEEGDMPNIVRSVALSEDGALGVSYIRLFNQ
jgi:WD40 repeat protein